MRPEPRKDHGPKEHIEKRLRRTSGMSADKLDAMHKANESLVWSGRCWNCRQPFSAVRSQICTCTHCGVNLWKRT